MKRVLCFLLILFLVPGGGIWAVETNAVETIKVDEGDDDPIGDILLFPFRVVGEAFSTSGYEYDPDQRYAWNDNYYGYWGDPYYYDSYDYRYNRYRHGGAYFGFYDPWYGGGYYRHGGHGRHHGGHYRHHGGRHHDGGGRHHGGGRHGGGRRCN